MTADNRNPRIRGGVYDPTWMDETVTARANDLQRRIAEHQMDAARLIGVPPAIMHSNTYNGHIGAVSTAHTQVTANLNDASVRDELIRQGWTPPGQESLPYSRQRNEVLVKAHTNVAVRQVFEASNRAGTPWLQTVETIALHMITHSEELQKKLTRMMSSSPMPPQMMNPNEMVSVHRRVPDSTDPRGYREEIVRYPNLWRINLVDETAPSPDRPPGEPRWR